MSTYISSAIARNNNPCHNITSNVIVSALVHTVSQNMATIIICTVMIQGNILNCSRNSAFLSFHFILQKDDWSPPKRCQEAQQREMRSSDDLTSVGQIGQPEIRIRITCDNNGHSTNGKEDNHTFDTAYEICRRGQRIPFNQWFFHLYLGD